jgi:UDP-N-acetylmuramoyl-tripeptide--D-alanyl-D-alanine ligase
MSASIQKIYSKYKESGKVSTDTRQITPRSVFFALKGPNFNANEFAKEALTKGASCVIVDEEKFVTDERIFLVDDGLTALQELAKYHRNQLNIPFVGLTGSNGKTTSKELVSAVLSKKFKTYATKGNLNNHIGVPLTILSIDSSHEMAVIEMGANHLGEIALLCNIANPTHGFITNIGRAHIGTFGGYENIIRGKSELFQHLISHDGQVFINSQNPILANMSKRFKQPLFYPSKGDYYHAELIDANPLVRIKAENGDEIKTQMIGAYNFENIAAALCIGKFFGVEDELANAAITEYTPGNMRSQVMQKGNNTIILDAYNANPSSMEAAINNLAEMKASRKIAILGDMYELEDEAEAEHKKLGSTLKAKGIREAYLCGKLIQAARETFPEANFFETKEELNEKLKKESIQNATILIKASRGMAMEKVIDYI